MSVVLHVCAVWNDEVRATVLQFVAAAPQDEHHLLRGTRGAVISTADEHGLASVAPLPALGRLARRTIRRGIVAVEPDVVHAHGPRAGLLVRTAVRRVAPQHVVVSPHGFTAERRELAVTVRMLARAAERMLASRTQVLAATTPREAQLAARSGVGRVVFVPGAARVPALAMLEHRQPGRVVGVGPVGVRTDPDLFRATVQHLRGHGNPGIDARWIGEGDDRMARARLERAGIPVSGWLSSFDASCALASAGVLLHTARWHASPVAILDAIELGVPVIARDVPTASGLTATAGLRTAAQLAAAVQDLLDGGDAAREANLAAWRSHLSAHTVEQQSRALAAAYEPTRANVLINGAWISGAAGAARRYAAEVTRHVLDLDPATRVVVPRGAVLPEWLPAGRVVASSMRGAAFEQVALPWLARHAMLLNLTGSAPIVTRDQLVVLHDVTSAALRRRPSRAVLLWHAARHRAIARRARHLATVSEFSRDEVAAVLGVDPMRVALAPNASDRRPSGRDSWERTAETLLALATDAPVAQMWSAS